VSYSHTRGTGVDTLQQQFGQLIRRRRTAIGLGQEGLADKANIHRTHVSLLERGKRMPSLLVVQKLARALETTMASLMAELEQGPADESEKAEQGKRGGADSHRLRRPQATRTKRAAPKKRGS
jgi:transcriptional regulator with XRE-family HTH domain